MRSKRKLAPHVIILGVAAFLNDVSSDMIYPLLPLYLTATLGATPLILGLIEGSAEALSAFLKYATGWWSDRSGKRKPFVVAGYAMAALSRSGIALAMGWPLVFAARLFDRTGKGIRSAPRDAMITDVTPPEMRGKAFGLHRALDNAGAIIGPMLAFALLTWLGVPIRTVILLAILPAAAGVVMLAVLLRETRSDQHAASVARPSTATLPANREFRRGLVSIGLFYLANSSDAFLILRAHEAGVAAKWIPLLWAAHHVVKVLFLTQAGNLSDRYGRRKLLFAGWIAYSIVYLLFPSANSWATFLALFVAYAIPFTLTEGNEKAWVADLAGTSKGTSFGAYYLVSGLSTLAGSTLFGLLYVKVSPAAAFQTGAALAILAASSLLLQKTELAGTSEMMRY